MITLHEIESIVLNFAKTTIVVLSSAMMPITADGDSATINPPRIFVIANNPHLANLATGALTRRGFNVVEQRHHIGTIRERQVRYFHEVDRSAAQKLARSLDAKLRDFTFYKPKPRQGNIEFWPSSK